MRTVLRFLSVVSLLSLCLATPAVAADLEGRVADRTGGVLTGTTVRLLNVATSEQVEVTADATGRFRFPSVKVGIYRLVASRPGFSDASRTVVVESDTQTSTVDFDMEIGNLRAEVTVSAARGERDPAVVPLRTDTLTADVIHEQAPASTGDAMVAAPGVTPVGSGPFQVRPKLRGLDSTRVLILVDGERLNNARTATDRAGVEVGLVDVDSIERLEVLGGAGSVLYGTDALSGTINIITNHARLTESDRPLMTAGFDGFYSSNESGRRGTVSLGLANRRVAVSFLGGTEKFDNYSAGKDFAETSQPFFDSGRIKRADTIDDNFGFKFKKFPDPFNAPFTRTSAEIPNSGSTGSSANLSAVARLAGNQTLDFKYQHRNAESVGFPDFAQPFFFQGITLPWSRLDKGSATYILTNPTPWLSKLTATGYYQQQDRLLRNTVPVQFPAPSAQFFPITVFGLNILSDTRQRVWTPGVDVQATFFTTPSNVLTAGLTMFRDRSQDDRTTTTQQSMIGNVALGPFGPAATVFASPILVGDPTIAHPVRVPNATFRDTAVFLHDEWSASRDIRITGGLRVDGYAVHTADTPGYTVQSLVTGAVPSIDPTTLPNVNGDQITRSALTGEAGVTLHPERRVSYFAHYVRSYRHPNLEELLFSGPATTGNIVPNVKVNPETGHNVDVGTRVRLARVNGSLAYFNNTYSNFISTEIVAQTTSQSGVSPISQAINLARVRIQGVEGEANAPVFSSKLTWLPYANVSYNRGTVLEGTSPLSGLSLAGKPQDNITPWKIAAGLRVGDRAEHWWGSYSLRAQGDVTRLSPLLSDSPFLIAQDLFGLGGFTIHRAAAGYDWRQGGQSLSLTLSVDNLTNVFYREQFQFAPARGRSVSVSLRIHGTR
ncbi:MAG: TonB-dependent receptor [Acidobacteriota bacterium]